jgi:undecaprenyl diphosphate synthase
LKSGLSEVGEKEFESALFTAVIPCPVLVVRTGGEIRISNFMLYQLAYIELMFTDCYWPDYDEKRLEETLAEYASRTRKFGG